MAAVSAYLLTDDDPIVFSGDAGSPSSEPPDPPENATEEAAQRPFWTSQPETLPYAEETISYEGDGNGPYVGEVAALDPLNFDLRVLTPRELVEEGPTLAGLPVVVVGRLQSNQALASDFIERELRLEGRSAGFDMYVGTDDVVGARSGDVVYALGRIAAIGESETPSGDKARTAYFLSLQENGGSVESPFTRQPGSRALQRAIRRLG